MKPTADNSFSVVHKYLERMDKNKLFNIIAAIAGLIISIVSIYYFTSGGETVEKVPTINTGVTTPTETMKGMIPLVMLNYILMMAATFAFIYRFLKPKSPFWIVYLIAFAGTLSGYFLYKQFVSYSDLVDVSGYAWSSPWIVGMPCVIILLIITIIDIYTLLFRRTDPDLAD